MTISRLFLSVCMLGFVFLASCSKDEDTTGTSTSTKQFTAKIDGTAWDGSVGASVAKITTGGMIFLNLQGSVNTLNIQITVTNPTVGTFNFGILGSQNMAQLTDLSGSTPKVWSTVATGTSAGSGSVVISKLTDTEIEGTFNFKAKPFADPSGGTDKDITEGKFAVKF